MFDKAAAIIETVGTPNGLQTVSDQINYSPTA
jgi:hypothetical protein